MSKYSPARVVRGFVISNLLPSANITPSDDGTSISYSTSSDAETSPSTAQGTGNHDTALTPLQRTRYSDLSKGKLNKIANMLRAKGITAALPSLKLPRLVVMGNEGSGKSSLIEAIAGIRLPRAFGTTTRCPMEIILKTSGDAGRSKYRVSLRYEVGMDSSKAIVRPDIVFDATQDPYELTLIIKRAQLAILNPTKDPQEFRDLDQDECESYESENAFSESLVVVEVAEAPADLAFIDLPGIISHTEKVVPPSYATNCHVGRRRRFH